MFQGMVPARYQVMQQMLNRLQYILQHPDNSLINRVYQAQKRNPTKGDWASETEKIVHQLEVNLSDNEIQQMNTNKYKALVKKKSENAAFKYLYEKQQRGKKGKFIAYKTLKISDYLLPDSELTMEEKCYIFSLRTEMNDLPCNFGNQELCYFGCQEVMSNQHIMVCPKGNSDNTHNIKYEYLLDGNVAEKKEAMGRYKDNEKRFLNVKKNVHT